MTDDLDPRRLRELIEGRYGGSLSVVDETASTMDDASEAARAGAPDGHVVLADRQTRGRGAHGRAWASPAGTDLYFSIVARPEIDPGAMALVTLATGLGVRETAASRIEGKRVAVKWPNDIWVQRRKCAGILVESRMLGPRVDAVIIGVGLNVNRIAWSPELEATATSLRAEGDGAEPLDRARVFADALAAIEHWVGRLVRDGAGALVDALRPHLALVGEEVRWEDGEGVFHGIDRDGAALVKTTAGLRTLHAARLMPTQS